jgi:hypothetical protein
MSKALDMLPPDVKAMLRAEQARDVAPPGGRDRLAERLSVAVPGFGAPHLPVSAPPVPPHAVLPVLPATGILKAGVAKAILVLAIGGGTVATVGVARHAGPAVHAMRVEPTSVAAAPAQVVTPAFALPSPAAPAVAEETSPPPASLSVTSAPSARTPPALAPAASSNAESSSEMRLREEQVPLDAARDAIRRSDPEAALGLLATHAARFPRGVLAEERVALQIRALSRLGRRAEAQALLSTMRASYPHSFLLGGAANDVDTIP